ncbi:MAG TPA: NAD(P)H-dependent oxidoreductase [Sedimentisphaerales bacterium]|nr:NAD(P)H-dependent oxidoreductase [Sedimentisphaerales bacterium]
MSKILYIQASPRRERSHCIAAADAFIKIYKQAHSDDEIDTLKVFETTLPDFDGFAVQAKYAILHGQPHTPQQAQAWKGIERIIEQFKAADKYLIAVPMWNFSIPYRLKQYLDIIVQPGYTFSYSASAGYKGLVAGRPLLVVYARGGDYRPGNKNQAFDLQTKYIELIFAFMGFTHIQSVIIEPTLQGGPDVAAAVRQEAIQKLRMIAPDF